MLPQMFLCQNFIPTNGVLLLSNKFKNRSTESQKSSKNRLFLELFLSLDPQDLQDLTPFNVTSYKFIYMYKLIAFTKVLVNSARQVKLKLNIQLYNKQQFIELFII